MVQFKLLFERINNYVVVCRVSHCLSMHAVTGGKDRLCGPAQAMVQYSGCLRTLCTNRDQSLWRRFSCTLFPNNKVSLSFCVSRLPAPEYVTTVRGLLFRGDTHRHGQAYMVTGIMM